MGVVVGVGGALGVGVETPGDGGTASGMGDFFWAGRVGAVGARRAALGGAALGAAALGGAFFLGALRDFFFGAGRFFALRATPVRRDFFFGAAFLPRARLFAVFVFFALDFFFLAIRIPRLRLERCVFVLTRDARRNPAM